MGSRRCVRHVHDMMTACLTQVPLPVPAGSSDRLRMPGGHAQSGTTAPPHDGQARPMISDSAALGVPQASQLQAVLTMTMTHLHHVQPGSQISSAKRGNNPIQVSCVSLQVSRCHNLGQCGASTRAQAINTWQR